MLQKQTTISCHGISQSGCKMHVNKLMSRRRRQRLTFMVVCGCCYRLQYVHTCAMLTQYSIISISN